MGAEEWWLHRDVGRAIDQDDLYDWFQLFSRTPMSTV